MKRRMPISAMRRFDIVGHRIDHDLFSISHIALTRASESTGTLYPCSSLRELDRRVISSEDNFLDEQLQYVLIREDSEIRTEYLTTQHSLFRAIWQWLRAREMLYSERRALSSRLRQRV